MSGKRPSLPAKRRELVSKLSTDFPPHPVTQVNIFINNQAIDQGVLTDSGADKSLMDWGIVKQLKIKTVPLSRPINASA